MTIERKVVLDLSVKGADKASREVQKTTKAFNAAEEARKQLTRAEQDAAVRVERRRIDPAFDREERERARRETAAEASASRSRMLRRAAVAGAVSNVVGGVMSATAKTINEFDPSAPGSAALKNLYVEITEGIPIFGQLFKGARELGQAMTGLGQQMKNAAEFGAFTQRTGGLTQAEIEGRGAMRAEIGGLRRGVEAARLRARFGVTPVGELSAAEAALAARRGEVGPLEALRGQASANVADERAFLQDAELSQRQGQQFGLSKGRQGILDQEVKDANVRLTTKLKAEEEALKAVKDAQLRTMEAINAAGEKRLNLSRAEADKAKERLSTLQQEEARARAGAVGFQMLSPLEQRGAIDALQQLKRGGLGGLRPEQAGLLRGLPGASDLLDQAALADAERNPLARQFLDLTGQRSLGAIRRDIKVTQEVVVKLETDAAKIADEIAKRLGMQADQIEVTVRRIQENREAMSRAQAAAGQPPG